VPEGEDLSRLRISSAVRPHARLALLLLLIQLAAGAKRATNLGHRQSDWKTQPRLQGRGAHVWEIPAEARTAMVGDINRLHAHGVADKVAIYQYVPAVRRFLNWALEKEVPFVSTVDKDKALAHYMSHLCFIVEAGVSEGRCAYAGMSTVFPELAELLPQAKRALQAWTRLHVAGEGSPIPWEGVGVIAAQLEADGELEASDIVWLSADCALRESDWSVIRRVDVVETPQHGVALLLGVAERGEQTKTGIRQGVRPELPGVVQRLQRRCASLRPQDKLFKLTPAQYRHKWSRACRRLGYNPGPPHQLRHTGPSYDYLTGYRSLDQIRVRGRWAPNSSTVQRYTKTHTYIEAQQAIPPQLRDVGQAIYDKAGPRPAAPKG
jgi:hypothetical protein